jgi:pilus assembly protein CpaE
MTILCEPLRRDTRPLLAVLGDATGAVSTIEELADLVGRNPGELLVVLGPGVNLNEACAFADGLRLSHPAAGAVLLRHKVDADVLAKAMRSGIREVVLADEGGAIQEACARSLAISGHLAGSSVALAASAAAAEEAAGAQVITVFAAKGGTGKTTVATNLAVTLAAGGSRRVCLIDLDLAFGDVAITLQQVPEKSMADAVIMADRLDVTGLRALLTPYAPGIDTLLAPPGPTDGEHVSRALIAHVIKVARSMFDYVVIDTPPYINDQVLAALDATHHFVLVATPDIPALKNLRVTLDMFDMLSYPAEHRYVVLNRADAKVGLTPADIEASLRVPITTHIPSSRDIPMSGNQGVPIMTANPGHPVSRAIRELALSHLGGIAEPAPEPPRSRWSRKSLRPQAVAR